VGDIRYPGALALAAGEPAPAPLLPPPVSVTDDWVRIERWDCVPMTRFPMDACTRPVEAPQRRIVVVGDSHAQQLAGALVPIADRHGWQLTVIARGACPFSTASEVVADEADCLAWGEAARPRSRTCGRTPWSPWPGDVRRLTERTPPGFVVGGSSWRAGHPGAGVPGQPAVDRSMPDCVQSLWAQSSAAAAWYRGRAACAVERAAVYAAEPPWTHVPDLPANVRSSTSPTAYAALPSARR
jgi:hypothetical protein